MILRRSFVGPIIKRSVQQPFFARTQDEMLTKVREEDEASVKYQVKRSVTDADVTESHVGGCVAKRQWIDMGADYYPRYVKSYHCSATPCDRGYGAVGECKPKHYTTKVLKRLTSADGTSVEDCDQTLPEALRVNWKLTSVSVTTCCDCVNSPERVFTLND